MDSEVSNSIYCNFNDNLNLNSREAQKPIRERKPLPNDPFVGNGGMGSDDGLSSPQNQGRPRTGGPNTGGSIGGGSFRGSGGSGGGGVPSAAELDAMNALATAAFNTEALDTCEHCGRTFLPEKLKIHNKSCTAEKPARRVDQSVRKSADIPQVSRPGTHHGGGSAANSRGDVGRSGGSGYGEDSVEGGSPAGRPKTTASQSRASSRPRGGGGVVAAETLSEQGYEDVPRVSAKDSSQHNGFRTSQEAESPTQRLSRQHLKEQQQQRATQQRQQREHETTRDRSVGVSGSGGGYAQQTGQSPDTSDDENMSHQRVDGEVSSSGRKPLTGSLGGSAGRDRRTQHHNQPGTRLFILCKHVELSESCCCVHKLL